MAEEINAPENMFQSWDGKPIYAKKAERDVNGNLLELTIVDDVVTAIGGKSVGGGGGGSDIPSEGEVGQVLTKTQDGYGWDDIPAPDPELPSAAAGDVGKRLTVGNNGSPIWDSDLFVEITDFNTQVPLSSARRGEIQQLWFSQGKIPYIKYQQHFMPMYGLFGSNMEFISIANSRNGMNGYATISMVDGTCSYSTDHFSYHVENADASNANYYTDGRYNVPINPNYYLIFDFSNVASVADETPVWIRVGHDKTNGVVARNLVYIKDITVAGTSPLIIAPGISSPGTALTPLPGSLTEISSSGDYLIKVEGDFYKMIKLGVQEKISQFDNDSNYIASPNGGTAGQVLSKTANGVAWVDAPSASLPVATEDDSILYTAEANGEAAWVQLNKTEYATIMTDEEGTPILDEEEHTIQSEDSDTLWTGFNGVGFGAERAIADENGNNIVSAYATKAEVAEVVAKIGSIADGGTLTDGVTINVANNAVSMLTTAQSALTLNVNLELGEIANFAVEITTSVNATLTVTSTIGNTVTTLHPSVAGGTSLESSKIYQVTCVGSCWTVAEFEVISA